MIFKQFTVILLLFSINSIIFADIAETLNIQNRIINTGSRLEGTAEERNAFEIIAERLETLGIPYKRQSLGTKTRGHSFSENIEATISGTSSTRYVLASPVEGGAFSSALLLEIAANLVISPPHHTFTLFFLGGERGDTPYHPYGSRYAAETIQPDSGDFVIYLDAETIPLYWNVKTGGDDIAAPYWLAGGLVEIMYAEAIPYFLRGADLHVANFGLQGELGSYSEWLQAGIPAIALEGTGRARTASEEEQINRLVRALLDLDIVVSDNQKKTERNYLYIHPFDIMNPLFIRELPFIIFVLILISVMVSSILLQYRPVYLNFKRFVRYVWTWPLLFFLVYLFLFLSTLLVEELLYLKDFPSLWTYAPGIFLFFKFTITVALSLSFIVFTHGNPLPRQPHFYSYTAVLTAFILILVITVIDITMTLHALWITLSLLLFAVFKNLKAKIFFFLLAVIPYIMIMAVVFTQPYTAVMEFLLLDRISGNLLNAAAILPVILVAASLNYWQSHYKRENRYTLIALTALIISLVSVITLMWLLRLSPFNNQDLQPMVITEHINLPDNSRWLTLESPGPSGRVELAVDGQHYSTDEVKGQTKIEIPPAVIPLQFNSSSILFLGRRTITIELSGQNTPRRIKIQLRSEEPFTLHASSLPFEMISSGRKAEIFVGDNPSLPLEFQFTAGSESDIILEFTADWINYENAPILPDSNYKPTVRRVLYAEYNL